LFALISLESLVAIKMDGIQMDNVETNTDSEKSSQIEFGYEKCHDVSNIDIHSIHI
jgi:hypothetical protein